MKIGKLNIALSNTQHFGIFLKIRLRGRFTYFEPLQKVENMHIYFIILISYFLNESNEGKKHIIAKINAMHSQIMRYMVNFDKPIVIGMHGKIESFFMGISFAAEYRIATPDTVLVRINAKLGLPPDGVFTFFLIRNLGPIKAIDLLLSESSMNASEAYDLGLLTEIVNENELENICLEKLKRICELPSYLISATRRLVQPEPNELNNFINRSYQDYYMNLMVMQQKSE